MDNPKILSALCYFSILFSPLLLPVIIYFISSDREVKFHAKRSLISHLIPVFLLIVAFIITSFSMMSFEKRMLSMMNGDGGFHFWSASPFIFMMLYGALFISVLIWNLYQGVKLLR